jgi:hypothetical protein
MTIGTKIATMMSKTRIATMIATRLSRDGERIRRG